MLERVQAIAVSIAVGDPTYYKKGWYQNVIPPPFERPGNKSILKSRQVYAQENKVDGAPVVAGYLAGGVLVHQRRFNDVVPALCDVPFPLPAHAVGRLFVQRNRDGIAADQDRKHDRPFEPVDGIVGKHRDESLLDTQFQHLPRHLLCSSYDIWRRSARQNDTFDDELENLIK